MLRTSIQLALVSILSLAGCASAPTTPLRERAHSIEFWADQARVEEALGAPDSVLTLDHHARGCRERWAYTECRNGVSSVVFVDFDADGHVCDHSIGALGEFHHGQ